MENKRFVKKDRVTGEMKIEAVPSKHFPSGELLTA